MSLHSPVYIYKKIMFIDWSSALHTYTNISFFEDDGTNTVFKWQESPESPIMDAMWSNADYRDIRKIPVGI